MSKEKTRVVIAGGAGRMGGALVRCCQNIEGVELVGATEYEGHERIGDDLGTIAGIDPVGVPLSSDLASLLKDADVLIDFSYHHVVPDHARTAAEHACCVVVGSTGLSDDESDALRSVSEKVAVVWAPNMSPGVNLLFAMAERTAALLGPSYQVTIDDTHHIHKKDAPSGTALRLGEKVAEGAGVAFADVYIHDEGGKQDQYPKGSIAIRSFREGENIGDHTVCYDGVGESVSLQHHAKSRDAFAVGALQAAIWVVAQTPRLYDMQDVLGLRAL